MISSFVLRLSNPNVIRGVIGCLFVVLDYFADFFYEQTVGRVSSI